MAKTMTTSVMTDGQINRFMEIFRGQLVTHASEFSAEAVQAAFGRAGMPRDILAAFRKHVEAESKMIVRHFKVDRTKTPTELLAACNRVPWYIDDVVLKTMPTDGPEEGELFFFPLERNTLVAEIPQVLDGHDLVPDYAAQMQVNADDPAFAKEHPNGMQWKKNSYACFLRFGDGRGVGVIRSDSSWSGGIWFAGRRK